MLRVILDTNVYGDLLKEHNYSKLKQKIIAQLLVYGYGQIRKELRDISTATRRGRQTRIILLEMYDHITNERTLPHSEAIANLARSYHGHYKLLGGVHGWESSIAVDFMIVACASLEGLDAIYSADKRTLLSKRAVEAYRHVNKVKSIKTPQLLEYQELLKKLNLPLP